MAVATTSKLTPSAALHAQLGSQSTWIHPSQSLRLLSTATDENTDENEDSSSRAKETKSNLRKLVQPFLLKCHPDMIVAQSHDGIFFDDEERMQLSQTIKDANLEAIQNLNMYLDTVQSILEAITSYTSVRLPDNNKVLVDFILLVEDSRKKGVKKRRKALVMSRRKIELALPGKAILEFSTSLRGAKLQEEKTKRARELKKHTVMQLSKLLRIAGLEVPKHLLMGYETVDEAIQKDNTKGPRGAPGTIQGDASQAWTGEDPNNDRKFCPHRYKANQEAFVRSIDWNVVDKMHKEAVADMEADIATENLYSKKNNIVRRRKLIADIMSNIKVNRTQKKNRTMKRMTASMGTDSEKESESDDTTTTSTEERQAMEERKQRIQQKKTKAMLDELVAMRRISLLMEDNFDELELEELGSMWWNRLQLILTEPRPYNTSATAIYKRVQKRAGDNGFSFTLHEDSSVSMTVPLDFRDEEFLNEVLRNKSDFQDFIGDGTDGLFYDGAVPF